jgi:ribosomal protein S18 acetylase RimI-like enzyme
VQVILPLTFRDMTRADIATMGWSGGQSHLNNMQMQLSRAAEGKADYLVACPPSDLPVGKCGIDYQTGDGTGMIWQVAVHPALQSLGIGTALIAEAEVRIKARGVGTARLNVENNNPRARKLYERLGYVARDETTEYWMTDDGCYEAVCMVMFKPLR